MGCGTQCRRRAVRAAMASALPADGPAASAARRRREARKGALAARACFAVIYALGAAVILAGGSRVAQRGARPTGAADVLYAAGFWCSVAVSALMYAKLVVSDPGYVTAADWPAGKRLPKLGMGAYVNDVVLKSGSSLIPPKRRSTPAGGAGPSTSYDNAAFGIEVDVDVDGDENDSGDSDSSSSDDEWGEDGRECPYCLEPSWQALRTKHCHDCGKCVRRFDHHCGWLGTCVGEVRRRHAARSSP